MITPVLLCSVRSSSPKEEILQNICHTTTSHTSISTPATALRDELGPRAKAHRGLRSSTRASRSNILHRFGPIRCTSSHTTFDQIDQIDVTKLVVKMHSVWCGVSDANCKTDDADDADDDDDEEEGENSGHDDVIDNCHDSKCTNGIVSRCSWLWLVKCHYDSLVTAIIPRRWMYMPATGCVRLAMFERNPFLPNH